MANPSITIPLDPQTARAYDSASPEEKRKIQALLSLGSANWLWASIRRYSSARRGGQ
jgi:hypothetical protein